MAPWMLLALLMSADSSVVQPLTLNHVRSEEPRFRDAIADGYARSATFRELVDATEALSCIVYSRPPRSPVAGHERRVVTQAGWPPPDARASRVGESEPGS